MKDIYSHAMVKAYCKDSPWYYFLPKLKITIFQILTKLGISGEMQIVLFVVNIAYYAKQIICTYKLCLFKAYI